MQACLVQLGPKECLLVGRDAHSDAGKLRQMVTRCGVLVTDRKRGKCWLHLTIFSHSHCGTADFSSKDLVQDLNRLLHLESLSSSAALRESLSLSLSLSLAHTLSLQLR